MHFSKNSFISAFLDCTCFGVSGQLLLLRRWIRYTHKSPSSLDFLPMSVTRGHCLAFPRGHGRSSSLTGSKHSITVVCLSSPLSHAPSPAPWQPCLCSLHLCLHFCSLLKKQSFPHRVRRTHRRVGSLQGSLPGPMKVRTWFSARTTLRWRWLCDAL